MSGTARPITIVGNPVLHAPCKPVAEFTDALRNLIDDMFASMYEAEGVGLAANQIGIPLRVFVYDCPDASQERQIGHIVNPTIVELPLEQRKLVEDDEGCLSVPSQHARIARPDVATVTGFDMTGAPITVTGTGLLSRCFRHETDHLNGQLYIDKLPAKKRKAIVAAVMEQ